MPGAFRIIDANVATALMWVAPFQTTGLFPQARVLDSDGDIEATVDLSANANIAYAYEGNWTPAAEGQYQVIYDVYTDSGRTILDEEFGSAYEFIRVRRISSLSDTQIGGGGFGVDEMAAFGDAVSQRVWERGLENGLTAEQALNGAQFQGQIESEGQVTQPQEFPFERVRGLLQEEMSPVAQAISQGIVQNLQQGLAPVQEQLNQMPSALEGLQSAIGKSEMQLNEASQAMNQRLDTIESTVADIKSIPDQFNKSFEQISGLLNQLEGSRAEERNGIKESLMTEMAQLKGAVDQEAQQQQEQAQQITQMNEVLDEVVQAQADGAHQLQKEIQTALKKLNLGNDFQKLFIAFNKNQEMVQALNRQNNERMRMIIGTRNRV